MVRVMHGFCLESTHRFDAGLGDIDGIFVPALSVLQPVNRRRT